MKSKKFGLLMVLKEELGDAKILGHECFFRFL